MPLAQQGALIGQWYIQADDPSGEFLKLYGERYPGASPVTAANCHDAVLMAADAKVKGVALNDHLHNLKDFKGALGVYSSTSDNKFTLPATAKIITSTGFERLPGVGSNAVPPK